MRVQLSWGTDSDRSTSRSTAIGMGCIGLFMVPFAAVGIGAMLTGLRRAVEGNWREAFLLALMGLAFLAFSGGFILLLTVGWRKLKQLERRKAAHPDEPWLWHDEWATGRIKNSSRNTLWLSWIFATCWNLVALPIGFAGVREAIQQRKPGLYFVLLFPLVGIGVLTWAIRTSLRLLKYGVSALELTTFPGVIARRLAGTVRITSLLQPADGFDVTLTCVRLVTTGSGDNSSTSETVLWQDERRVRGEAVRDPAGFGTRIPISFRIPADAQPSDSTNSRDRIAWRLQLAASVPGVDYASIFEVPVFRTPDSERPLGADEADKEPVPDPADYRQPAGSRIAVTSNRRGVEIVFPAARNVGVAIGSLLFTLCWTGVLAALVRFDAPVVFPIVLGLLDLFLIVMTLQFWLLVTRVRAEGGRLVLAEGYGFPGGERSFAVSEISGISSRIGMQAGGRPYYDLVVLRKQGKPVTTGRWIRDKREAEWLALVIKDAIGLRSEKLGAGSRASAGSWELGA